MEDGTDAASGNDSAKGGLFDTTNKMLFSLAGIILGLFLYLRIKDIIDGFKTDKWPPEIDSCPNMWVKKGKNKCENVLGIGNKKCNRVIDFNNSEYKDPRSKCRWAKYTCNVDWDGYDKLC